MSVNASVITGLFCCLFNSLFRLTLNKGSKKIPVLHLHKRRVIQSFDYVFVVSLIYKLLNKQSSGGRNGTLHRSGCGPLVTVYNITARIPPPRRHACCCLRVAIGENIDFRDWTWPLCTQGDCKHNSTTKGLNLHF